MQANTAQPLYCCDGYMCPTPSEISPCPQNYYCPRGSTRGFPCWFLASCPEGTSSPRRIGVFLIVLLFVFIAWLTLSIKNRSRTMRYQKYSQSMLEISAHDAMHDSKKKRGATTLPRRVAEAERRRVFDIQFHNLGLTLHNGAEILKGVSGELKAGRLCAVMGPSGSGKTTFFNVLRGSVKRTTGTVSINGMEGELAMYRKLIGMVPQEDIMIRELTVLDTLMHSGKTRLPSHWTHSMVKQKVLETIDYLGLDNVMHQIIGDVAKRGLSGGQRKRLNVGLELVAEPAVLFADEPTSGLDSSTAFEVCSLLHSIARDQFITVAAVVHSPSPAAFERFDDVLLLAKGGRTVYFGERSFALAYFRNLGYLCPANMNHADFLLDVVSGKYMSDRYGALTPSDLVAAWDRYKRGDDPAPGTEAAMGLRIPTLEPPPVGFMHEVSDHIKDMWGDWAAYFKDVGSEFSEWAKSCITCSRDPIRETPSTFLVFWQCLRRASFQIYRTPSTFIMDQLLHLGAGAAISIASENIDYLGKQPSIICDMAPAALKPICASPIDNLRQIGVFMSLGVLFCGISVATNSLGNERTVYWRETATGQPTIPYFFAKLLADVPRMVVAAFMFTLSLILFWPYRSHFMVLYSVALLLYFCAFGMGYFLSVWVRPESVGLVGTGFALFWAMVLSGMIPSLESVKRSGVYDGISWLWDISPPRYAVEAIYVKEVQARPFAESSVDQQLYTYRISDFFGNLLIMFAIGMAWLMVALVSLKLANRDKCR
ncbi:P-loop containing nucleoside triphosphate hydrolase protein [Blastocladiella britannica]|nr:P-loop containing nucleoside triphosphate hydrolase protein [Blastocladiella britannica]